MTHQDYESYDQTVIIIIKLRTPDDHEMVADYINVPTSHFDINVILGNISI